MRITVTQNGGWANITLGCTIETTDFPPEQARDIEALLSPPPLTILRSFGSARTPDLADGLQYRLEAETENGTRIVCYEDAAKPDSLRRLLEALRPRFRPIPQRRPLTSR